MQTPTLTVRLPSDTRGRLDKAAMETHRSRAFIVKEALERHLNDIVVEQGGGKGRLDKLLALKGAGARRYGARTEKDIEAQIREFRGDE